MISVTWYVVASVMFGAFIIICYRLHQAQKRWREAIKYTARLKADFDALYRERHNLARLVDIKRNGRLNIFTFTRNGQIFTIETMGLLADDINAWKRQAGIHKGE